MGSGVGEQTSASTGPVAGAPSAATFEASAVLPSLLCFRGLSLPSFVLIMWSFSLSA